MVQASWDLSNMNNSKAQNHEVNRLWLDHDQTTLDHFGPPRSGGPLTLSKEFIWQLHLPFGVAFDPVVPSFFKFFLFFHLISLALRSKWGSFENLGHLLWQIFWLLLLSWAVLEVAYSSHFCLFSSHILEMEWVSSVCLKEIQICPWKPKSQWVVKKFEMKVQS